MDTFGTVRRIGLSGMSPFAQMKPHVCAFLSAAPVQRQESLQWRVSVFSTVAAAGALCAFSTIETAGVLSVFSTIAVAGELGAFSTFAIVGAL
jgi:hypothetical protein